MTPLEFAFTWAFQAMAEAEDFAMGKLDLDQSFLCTAKSGVSEFAGLHSDGQALKHIRVASAARGRRVVLAFEEVSEIKRMCQTILQADPDIKHVRPDITDYFGDYTFNASMTFQEKVRSFAHARPRRWARCRKCPGGICVVPWFDSPDLAVAGCPCIDISNIGQGLMQDGPTMELWLAFAHRHRHRRTKMIIIENLKSRFVLQLVGFLFADMYQIHWVDMSPRDAGFAFLRRERIAIVCLLIGSLHFEFDFYGLYQRIVQQLSMTQTSPDDILMGSINDVMDEAHHMLVGRQHLRHSQHQVADALDFLSGRERKVVHHYYNKKQYCHSTQQDLRNTIVYLGDDGRYLHKLSTVQISTYRHAGGLFWSLSAGRWVLAKEMMASMGWPTFEHLARAAGVQQTDLSLCPPNQWRAAVGNAFHVANIGMVLVAALVCAKLD